jgi:hypothetical protein
MTREEALTELATINAALTEYYSGKRRTTLIVWSAGIKREYHYSDPAKLFECMMQRKRELEAFLASLDTSASVLSQFNKNTNVPFRFRRAY